MGAVVKRYFAKLINKEPEDICLVIEQAAAGPALVAPCHALACLGQPVTHLPSTPAHIRLSPACTHPSSADARPCLQVSVMPCTAKKYEAERGEMRRDGEGPDIGGCTQGQPHCRTCLWQPRMSCCAVISSRKGCSLLVQTG